MAAGHFKDDSDLLRTPLPPLQALAEEDPPPRYGLPIVAVYNRFGGLMAALAAKIGVDLASVLAVWLGDCSAKPWPPGAVPIFFDIKRFHDNWVNPSNRTLFDAHFAHMPVKRKVERFRPDGMEPDQYVLVEETEEKIEQFFRRTATDPFEPINATSESRRTALSVAMGLAEDRALRSTDIGCPRLDIHNYRAYGFASSLEMFQACERDERFLVLGFLNRGRRSGPELDALRAHNWREFARHHLGTDYIDYVGASMADSRGARYREVYDRVAVKLASA